MLRSVLALLAVLLRATAAHSAALAEVVDFDVDGNGMPETALRLTHVATEWDGGFTLSQPVELEPEKSYCLSFRLAVANVASEGSGRFRFDIDLASQHRSTITPLLAPGQVHRDRIEFLVNEPLGSATQIKISIHHDAGPTSDPALYLSLLQLQPLSGERFTDSFVQEIWVSDSTVLGWEHDFRLWGLQAGTHIGTAVVELVFWDDDPTADAEYIDVTVNDVHLPRAEPDGEAGTPHHIFFPLTWLECTHANDLVFVFRLRTVPAFGRPAGDLFFAAAHTTLELGALGGSILVNGGFDDGVRGWLCDGRACAGVQALPTTWSHFKGLFR